MNHDVSRETFRRWRAAPLLVLVLAALFLIGCGAVTNPDGWAAPVVDGDTMYAVLRGDRLAALSADGIEERWRFPAEHDKKIKIKSIYGEPVVSEDRVFVGGYDGKLYALNKRDGTIVWSAATDGPIIGGATLAGDVVLVGSGDRWIYAFARADGALRWRVKTGDRVWAKPVVRGDTAYVPSLDGKLYALRVADGSPIWKEPFQAEAGLPSSAVIADEHIIVGSLDKRLYALRASDGSVVWAAKADNWFWTTALVAEGRVYAGNLDGTVYAYNLADGQRVWTYEADAPVRASPTLADGVVVVAAQDGIVHGIRANSGEQAWATDDLQATLYANVVPRGAQVLVLGKGGKLWSLRASDGSTVVIRDKS